MSCVTPGLEALDGSPLSIGIDFGSVNIKVAVLGRKARQPLLLLSEPSRGLPGATAQKLIAAAEERLAFHTGARVGVTGSTAPILPEAGGLIRVNEVAAAAAAAGSAAPSVRTIFDLGGQTSKWIRIDPADPDGVSRVLDFGMNGLCAAGGGAFMDQQAARLGMDGPRLGALAMAAEKGAAIAGRCSVFAKSDMIHLQQKGTPMEEIAYGLCLALARTFAGTVLRGRAPDLPVGFVGGGASNPGLVRALVEVLRLDSASIVSIPSPLFASAVGAAMGAEAGQEMSAAALLEILSTSARPTRAACLPVLDPRRDGAPPRGLAPASTSRRAGPSPVHLGIDVGSVSTNVVLLDDALSLIDETYLPTAGDPIRALSESFEALRGRHRGGLQIRSAGATGSGRHLAARVAGADVVRNEITAQLTAALHAVPEAETIFEIGGQDSKYISIVDGRLAAFEMNKICAAGTGSFLEEQATRLGVAIDQEFSGLALAAEAPPDLGSKCTVFMDTELCRAMASNAAKPDLCAGLAYAVARNYLEKVVAGRPVGETVVFQGGTSLNTAVVRAFESLLGQRIVVHPHGRVSGAIGAALLAARAHRSAGTAFLGLDACRDHRARSFTCRRCDNRCRVNRITVGRRAAHFGDVCERYSAKDRGAPPSSPDSGVPNLFEAREALMRSHLPPAADTADTRPAVGLVRASLNSTLLPFWATLLDRLDFRWVLPKRIPAEDGPAPESAPEAVCLPVKRAMAEVAALIDDPRVGQVLLPSVVHLPPRQERDRPNTCLYTQFLPDMARARFGDGVAAPKLSLSGTRSSDIEAIAALSRALDRSEKAVEGAWRLAKTAQAAFCRGLTALGKKALAEMPARGAVVLGKPYNLHDPQTNLNLARHLERAGLFALPMDLLPLDEAPLSERWYMLPWQLSRDQIRAAGLMAAHPNLFPIHVSGYGCGPDAFALKHLSRALQDRPRLFLEFDAHSGEAGLITRIEAFIDEIDSAMEAQEGRPAVRRYRPSQRPSPGSDGQPRLLMPYTSPHVHAYAGVTRAAGFRTEILPTPDSESVRLGTAVSSERECHPFSIIAGDLVKHLSAKGATPGDRFFFPGTRLPCLLSQYGDGLRTIAADMGAHGLEVFDPHPGELNEALGPIGVLQLYEGVSLIDMLIILQAMLTPRAARRACLEHAMADCFNTVERCLANRTGARAAMKRCMAILERIPLSAPVDRPLVGVTGDLYTRLNSTGNARLFDRLNALGCTVWPSPFFGGGIDFELPQDARRALACRDYRRAAQVTASAAVLKLQSRRLAALLPRAQRTVCTEPPFAELQAYAERYVDPNTNHLIRGIVAKMVDFARRGADGVINAHGIGCMVGVSASSTVDAIRRDHGNIPIISLAYGGQEGPSQQLQLETFVHQVRRFHETKQASGPAAATGE